MSYNIVPRKCDCGCVPVVTTNWWLRSVYPCDKGDSSFIHVECPSCGEQLVTYSDTSDNEDEAVKLWNEGYRTVKTGHRMGDLVNIHSTIIERPNMNNSYPNMSLYTCQACSHSWLGDREMDWNYCPFCSTPNHGGYRHNDLD